MESGSFVTAYQLFLFEVQQLGYNVLLHGSVLCSHLPDWSLQKLEEFFDES
jgi:hypothetical protein